MTRRMMDDYEQKWWKQFEQSAQCRIVPMMREIESNREHLQNDDCEHLGCAVWKGEGEWWNPRICGHVFAAWFVVCSLGLPWFPVE
jgi:hypothetical protein